MAPNDNTVRTWTFGEVELRPKQGGRLDRLCAELKDEFPRLVMQFKSRHWWWTVLHWILLIVTFGGNRQFIQKYTTTFRYLVGWSEKYEKLIKERPEGWEDRVWSCLKHEREHLRQFERYGMFPMTVLYVFVFLPAGLAYFRARFERQGYTLTLQCWFLLDPDWARGAKVNSAGQTARQWWVGQFTSGAYGWMWPFRKMVTRWYDQELSRLERLAA